MASLSACLLWHVLVSLGVSLRDAQTGLIGLKGMNMFPVEISYEGFKYSFTVQRQAPDAFILSINGQVRFG